MNKAICTYERTSKENDVAHKLGHKGKKQKRRRFVDVNRVVQEIRKKRL